MRRFTAILLARVFVGTLFKSDWQDLPGYYCDHKSVVRCVLCFHGNTQVVISDLARTIGLK
jgi:hypothetical protein